MAVHNHGPEEGRGLSCNELLLPDGSRRGACIITPDELAAVRGTKITIPEPTFDDPEEKILYDFISSIPAVRIRASVEARARGRKVDMRDPGTLISAAIAAKVFGRENLLALIRTVAAVKPTMTAEEAWAEHSIGMVWDSDKERYGEYRQFLAGFEYRDGLDEKVSS